MTSWLPSVISETPEQGHDLAVKLSRVAINLTRPEAAERERMRRENADDSDAPIAVSAVVATHFDTAAAADGYWRDAP